MIDPHRAPDPELLAAIPAEVLRLDYGCGAPWKWAREGETVLDLGCGAGKSCFLLSRIVGPEGRVIGIDGSDAMLAVARKHQGDLARAIGWANVRFAEGLVQDLALADAGIDLAALDCVLSLVPARDWPRAFAEILRVLRPGGRTVISDVLRDGADDLPRSLAEAGFERIEVLEVSAEVFRVIDGVDCRATTVRGFRRDSSARA